MLTNDRKALINKMGSPPPWVKIVIDLLPLLNRKKINKKIGPTFLTLHCWYLCLRSCNTRDVFLIFYCSVLEIKKYILRSYFILKTNASLRWVVLSWSVLYRELSLKKFISFTIIFTRCQMLYINFVGYDALVFPQSNLSLVISGLHVLFLG